MNVVIPLERVENSINQALQKSQDLNAQSRSKEEVSLLITRLQTKEQYDVFLRQILKSDFCVPVLERKFALYCIQKMCERLRNNVRPYVPKIMKYLCSRVKDNESLDDTAYNRQLVQTVSQLMKSLYKQHEVTDIYGDVIQPHTSMGASSTSWAPGAPGMGNSMSWAGASGTGTASSGQYSPFPPLNLIITRLMEYIQTEDHKTNAVVAQLLCEVFHQARAQDLVSAAPGLADAFYKDARRFADKFVYHAYQMQLLAVLTVLIQKFGVHILCDEAAISKYVKLVLTNLASQEFHIRLNACLLLKVILMQKILLPEQVAQFRAKIEDMKRSDPSNLVRKEAAEIWYLINQMGGLDNDSGIQKTPKMSFAEFKKQLREKNLRQKLESESQNEVRAELVPEDPPEAFSMPPEPETLPAEPEHPEVPQQAPEISESLQEPESDSPIAEPQEYLSKDDEGETFDDMVGQEGQGGHESAQDDDFGTQSLPHPPSPPPAPTVIPTAPPKQSKTIQIEQDDIPFASDVVISGVTQKQKQQVPNYRHQGRPLSASSYGGQSFTQNRPMSASTMNAGYDSQNSQNLQQSRVMKLNQSGGLNNSMYNRQHVDFGQQFQQLQDQKLNFNIYKQKVLQLLNKAQPSDLISIPDEQLRSSALDMVALLLSDGYINQASPWVYMNSQNFNGLQRRMMLQKLQKAFSGGQQWEDIARLQEILQ